MECPGSFQRLLEVDPQFDHLYVRLSEKILPQKDALMLGME